MAIEKFARGEYHDAQQMEKIARGEYYDAQQMVKMVYRRLCAKGQTTEAAELCAGSAKRFSGVGEHDLAADLGKDLVATFEDSNAEPCEENLGQIEAIVECIPPNVAAAPKYALLQQALKWSSSASASKGHPRLHRLAAKAYWAEHQYGKCQAHFVYCGDGTGLANMVREWRQRGYPNEEDLFALRTLLILLSLNDVATAREFWNAVATVTMPEAGGSASSTATKSTAPDELRAPTPAETPGATAVQETPEPTVQCGCFLLAAVEARNIVFFRMVRMKYALVTRRDSSFDKYLDEIEANVFGATTQQNGLGALFEVLLSGGGSI